MNKGLYLWAFDYKFNFGIEKKIKMKLIFIKINFKISEPNLTVSLSKEV